MKVIAVYFLVDILLRPRFLNLRKQNDEQFELVDGDDGGDELLLDNDDFSSLWKFSKSIVEWKRYRKSKSIE